MEFDLLPGSERVKADRALRRSISGAERGVRPGDGTHGHQQGGAQDLPQCCQLHQGDHWLFLTFNPDRSIRDTFCENLFIFHLLLLLAVLLQNSGILQRLHHKTVFDVHCKFGSRQYQI